MSFFGKLKDKLKVVVGAIALGAAGGGGGYWLYERVGFEINVERMKAPLGKAIFVGDTGEPGAIAEFVRTSIAQEDAEFLYLIGDLDYTNGVKNAASFNLKVKPWLVAKRNECILGNHDSYALNESERNFMAGNSDKLGCKFGNYYRGQVFTNICIGIADSTVYDVRGHKPAILENQEKFLRKFFDLEECRFLPKMIIAHHTIITYGPHRKDTREAWREFVQSLPVNIIMTGHDHLLAYTQEGDREYYVAGSGSKVSKCKRIPEFPSFCLSKPGYWAFDGKFFHHTSLELL